MRDARPPGSTTPREPRLGTDWWQRGVIYQVYPRSFADSDGDGTGDLRGIIDHLDHLGQRGLDVDAVWLSPIYPSPGRDVGYDVSDHAAVDPLLGTEADFDELVARAHDLGLRVILDLVMNHTSDEHPWFQASRRRQAPYTDWYIWRDPLGWDRHGRPIPPNAWVSWFGGPAWTFDPVRGQFYHHTFLAQQPELDWRVPAVEAAQLAMVRGWLDRGVDGFRLDTFNVFLKHPDVLDNPKRRGTTAWGRQVHQYDFDQPDLPDLIARFRALVDRYPDRMSVGELFVGTTEGAAALTTDRHLVFDWELITRAWDADELRAAIRRRERAFGDERWPTVVMSNHDQPRQASRLAASVGADPAEQDAIAKAAATLILTVRGTPFLYYGEELGMGDVHVPPEESIDPPASWTSLDFPWWDRSQARTPMPWTGERNGGFTTGRPWLRLGDDVATRNVAAQAADEASVLIHYRRLIATRREIRALQDGRLSMLRGSDRDVLAYRRHGEGRGNTDAVVGIDVGRRGGRFRLPRASRGTWRPVLTTHGEPGSVRVDADGVDLRPSEAVILIDDVG